MKYLLEAQICRGQWRRRMKNNSNPTKSGILPNACRCYRGHYGWRRRALQGCVTPDKPRQTNYDRRAGFASPLPDSQVQGTERYSAISNGFHSAFEHQSRRNLEVKLVIHENKKPHASRARVTQNKCGLLSAPQTHSTRGVF